MFNDIDNEDLSTTEDFDDIDDILRLGTTPQPFDIFQTTGPIIDEIRLWTTGPDYFETTKVPFGGFTTEEIGFGDFSTGAPEIDLSTVMTFPTDAPTLFTTGSIFDFTTIPDLVTLGVTAPVTGLPPIPETTEFVPLGTTELPFINDIIEFTTPFQFTPTVPEWLFQTTNSLDFPEFSTEDFTGIPFSTTPQPTQPTQPIEKPNKSPDAFDKDAFANAIENAVKAIEDNQSSEADNNNNNNPAIIDDNSVAVLIPVPNKSTTSSPVITSTSASTTTFSSTSATSTTASTTSSSTTSTSTTSSSTTSIITTKISTKSTSTTTTSTSTIATSSSSMSPSETTVVVASLPDTTAADEDIITNSLTTETDVSSVIVDVTTPADHVVDLTTGDIDVTGNACFIIYKVYIIFCKTYLVYSVYCFL